MKKFLAFAISALALTSVAFAQEGDEDTQPALAFVRVPMDVIGIRPMMLGDIERGLTDEPVDIPAWFRIYADEGDLINVYVNGGEGIVLYSQHGVVTSNEEQPTEGPPTYENDVNGQPDQPSTMITVTPELKYRFVDNDEAHAVTWGLPTWTARPGYCDIQEGDEYCIPDGSLPPGIGQINVYVGGTFDTTEDQQRGAYEGDVTLSAEYAE